jgi:hypothetical protein
MAQFLTDAKIQLVDKYQGKAFVVTDKSLETLKRQHVPESTISKLNQLSGRTFTTQPVFEQVLRQTINDAEYGQYGSKIIKVMKTDLHEVFKLKVIDETGSQTVGELQILRRDYIANYNPFINTDLCVVDFESFITKPQI